MEQKTFFKIIRDYFAILFAYKFENLDEMNIFLGEWRLLKLTPFDSESLSRPISIEETDNVTEEQPQKKTSTEEQPQKKTSGSLMASQRNSIKPLRPDKIGPVPCKLFQIIEKGGNFPSSLSETHSIET